MVGNGWKRMEIDGLALSDWKLLQMAVNRWKWMDVARNG